MESRVRPGMARQLDRVVLLRRLHRRLHLLRLFVGQIRPAQNGHGVRTHFRSRRRFRSLGPEFGILLRSEISTRYQFYWAHYYSIVSDLMECGTGCPP